MKNTQWLLIIVFVVSCLIAVPNGADLRDQRVVGFIFLMTVGVGMYILMEVGVVAGLLMLYAAVSMVRPGGSIITESALLGMGVFFVIVEKGKGREEFWYDAIIGVILINVVMQVLQYFGVYVYFHPGEGFCPGIMGNVNETSALCAMGMPAFMRRGRWWLLPVVIVGLVLAHSFQGMVAASVVLVIWAWRSLSLKGIVTVVVMVMVFGWGFVKFVKPFSYGNYRDNRMEIWEVTAIAASVKPLFGWGFGQYDKVIPLVSSFKYLSDGEKTGLYNAVSDKGALNEFKSLMLKEDKNYFQGKRQMRRGDFFVQAHNEYAEWLFTGGIAGMALALSFFSWYLWQGLRQKNDIAVYGLVSSMVCAVFGFNWHIMPLILMTVLYSALIIPTSKNIFKCS